MSPRKAQIAPICLIALAGAAAVWAATANYGIGVSAESETYIEAARNFAAGRGLSAATTSGEIAPLTQHAPLYPLALGAAARLGADPVAAARWIAAAAFFALALTVGLGLRALSTRQWIPAAGAAATAGSVMLLNLHLVALSEPLFLLSSAAALILLARYAQNGGERDLWGAAALASAALLTRYAGAAVIAAGAVALLRSGPLGGRLLRACRFAAAACAPAIVWGAYSAVRAGNPVHREFAFHPIASADALAALRAISTWALPGFVPPGARMALAAVGGLWLACGLYRIRPGAPCRVCLWFLGAYALLIAAAKSFFDAAIPMDDRILSPLYVPAVLAAALALDDAVLARGRRRLPVPALAAAVALMALGIGREAGAVAAMRRQGREYTGAEWRRSNLAAWLRSLDAGVPVYSNVDSAVRFLGHDFAAGLPAKADVRSGRPNAAFAADFARLRARLERGRGVVVYFTGAGAGLTYLPSLPELAQSLELGVVARGESWVALRPARPGELPL